MAMEAGKVSSPTDVQGKTHTSGYQVMLLAGAFAATGYLALQKRRS